MKATRVTMKVPLLDLRAQYTMLRRDVMAVVEDVCDRQQFIMGPEVATFEAEISAFLEIEHALGVSSGTDALLLAMMALGIGRGDEVITSTFSFFATAGCVARLGATPVLVDIDPLTFNLDPEAVRAALTPRTKAVVPVHLFGQSADMGALLDVVHGSSATVIEDAAQALGTRYQGKLVGSFGAVSCFSFFPSKNLGAFGDAGLIASNDDAMVHRMRVMRTHGAEPKYFHRLIGGNFRLDTLQAAVLSVKLPYLTGWSEARRRNAARYRQLFTERRLSDRVELPWERPGDYHIYNQFVIRVPDRDRLQRYLADAGIGTEIYYPVPFHLQECFAYLGYRRGQFPEAERAAAGVLALPIYPELTEQQQAYVVETIASYYRH